MAAPASCQNVLDLPHEILDMIFSYLMPVAADAMFRIMETINQSNYPTHWRKIAMSLRLSCKTLANYPTITAALFETFFLYPMKFSLNNLALLSTSHFAPLLRRVVFVRPQFEAAYRIETTFLESCAELLLSQHSHFVNSIQDDLRGEDVEPDQRIHDTPDAMASARGLARYSVSNVFQSEILSGHRQYLAGLEDQESTLSSGKYVIEGALALSRFKGIISVILCSGGGGFFDYRLQKQPSTSRGDTFLERRCPRVLRNLGNGRYPLKDLAVVNAFIASTLRVIALAQLKPLQLTMMQGLRLPDFHVSDDLALLSASLNLETLRHLKLQLEGSRDPWVPHRGIETCFGEAIQKCDRTLECLEINGSHKENGYHPRFDMHFFLERPFQALKEFYLDGLHIVGDDISRMVASAPRLSALELQEINTPPPAWRKLFVVLRDRTNLNWKIDFCQILDPEHPGRPLSRDESQFWFCASDPSSANFDLRDEQGRIEKGLDEFVSKGGDWTKILEARFGVIAETDESIS